MSDDGFCAQAPGLHPFPSQGRLADPRESFPSLLEIPTSTHETQSAPRLSGDADALLLTAPRATPCRGPCLRLVQGCAGGEWLGLIQPAVGARDQEHPTSWRPILYAGGLWRSASPFPLKHARASQASDATPLCDALGHPTVAVP